VTGAELPAVGVLCSIVIVATWAPRRERSRRNVQRR
jgi:hypothetical protein